MLIRDWRSEGNVIIPCARPGVRLPPEPVQANQATTPANPVGLGTDQVADTLHHAGYFPDVKNSAGGAGSMAVFVLLNAWRLPTISSRFPTP